MADDTQLEPDNANEKQDKRAELARLLEEHRELDEAIAWLTDGGEAGAGAGADQVQIQRLKKRKLGLKDEISRLQDAILPDIIA